MSCLLIAVASASLAGTARADINEYLSACMMGMAGGLVGVGVASASLEDGQSIGTTGYLIAGGITCLGSMALRGMMAPQAKFESEFELRQANENLLFNVKRLSKEKCLMNRTCPPEGNAILMETETEIRKQGGSVYTTTTTTIEAKD